MLMLTGQRRGETAAIQSSWIFDDRITFPAHITKNGQEHTIPVAHNAQSLLSEASRSAGEQPDRTGFKKSKLLFPSSKTGTVITGWTKLKEQLDKGSTVAGWTLHDLRRTFSTIHARIGTPPHITELLLNHKTSSHLTPIAKIYNRHQYFDEMKAAMQRYEAHLVQLCSPK